MLIREFRTPMPMTVEEYELAQLYSIQKMSRNESKGANDGVKFVINEPFQNELYGTGQYTKKLFYLASRLPSWMQFLVPNSAVIIEEAWNAYPVTRTKYYCPLVKEFSIEIETHFKAWSGDFKTNIFDYEEMKRNKTNVVMDPIVIDITDPKQSKEKYKDPAKEDSTVYISEKTKRGPLTPDWVQKFASDGMCSYKLIKINFSYWGLQSKVENFIMGKMIGQLHDIHRSVWVWQDEWYGLKMEDIRKIEVEAKLELENKLK